MDYKERYYVPSYYGIEDKQDKPFSPVCSKCGAEFYYMETMYSKNGECLCAGCFWEYVSDMGLDRIAEAMGFEVETFDCNDWR